MSGRKGDTTQQTQLTWGGQGGDIYFRKDHRRSNVPGQTEPQACPFPPTHGQAPSPPHHGFPALSRPGQGGGPALSISFLPP